MQGWLGVRRPAAVITWLLLATPALAQQPAWPDPSPHRTRMVDVAPGVSLETLDWGGAGVPLVLLAGGGTTAHVFDTFAPLLAAHYHVYGITRRGYGASSRPSSGYEGARLADDVVAVLDRLNIRRAVVVGHSLAGDELTSIGARHAEAVSGLVYLEAAYDRSDPAWDRINSNLPSTTPAPDDLASIDTLEGYMARMLGAPVPRSEIYNEFEFAPDGRVGRFKIPQAVSRAIAAGVGRPDYATVRVPTLAIYGKLPAIERLPGYRPDDPGVRAALETWLTLTSQRQRADAAAFRAALPDSRVVWLPGSHYVFLSNPDDTVREIDRFVASLP